MTLNPVAVFGLHSHCDPRRSEISPLSGAVLLYDSVLAAVNPVYRGSTVLHGHSHDNSTAYCECGGPRSAQATCQPQLR